MLNSDRFLKAFASIESYLRRQAGDDKSAAFYQLVETVGRSKPAVRSTEKDLKEFADLRNAIVHERSDGRVLAEPNDRAVSEIERIAALLLKPPAVIPLFQTQVSSLRASDPIGHAVKFMWEQSFSQIPIFDDEKFAGLLTSNTVTRWLGAKVSEDIFSLESTFISQVMEFSEDENNCKFIDKNATVFDVIELFQRHESQGKKLEAILITERGKPSEKIIGIITVDDLPKAFSEVGKFPS